ncbi:hypothetical protein DMT40_26595 [Klebsiella variicola]|nr:hypothetical protein DMT40_26595 [Klebsiella variicola]
MEKLKVIQLNGLPMIWVYSSQVKSVLFIILIVGFGRVKKLNSSLKNFRKTSSVTQMTKRMQTD